ncbi:MAG: OmpA family protein [Flavisolibacter sp.]
MKKLLSFSLLVALCFSYEDSAAQLNKLKSKIKQKVDQRVDQKTDKAIDKSLDKVEEGTKVKTETETEEGEIKDKKENEETKTKVETKGTGIKSFSKFDFVPGEKILYNEDFAQDVVGEFPLKWNTNGTGEIVTLDKVPGKWLNLVAGTKYEPPIKKKLPDNYTIEFDLLLTMKEHRSVPIIELHLDAEGGSVNYPLGHFILHPNGGTASDETPDRADFRSHENSGKLYLDGIDRLHNEITKFNGSSTPVHVALWIQKTRVRAWVNSIKVYDLPKGMVADVFPDQFFFEIGPYGSEKSNYQYYLSNVKLAEALPDTRSKLITEGKWSTTGILFDVNSDKIKPISYGVLKEIATTLKDNPDVKVKIIGHTDSDGDDAKNMDLSKRRAASVRIILTSEFDIDATRMETDGLGETKPVADNKIAEGKAQNRRVEFVKL